VRTWSPGFARTCQRTARFLSLLVFVWVIPGQQAAHAGEYPRSALSTSLGMAPELVDETSLLFRLPQRVGLAHSRLFVLANTSYSTFGYGLLGAVLEDATGRKYGELVQELGRDEDIIGRPIGGDLASRGVGDDAACRRKPDRWGCRLCR